ncbi:MAG: TIGR02680 family protein [Jiangellaceae bacterium]
MTNGRPDPKRSRWQPLRAGLIDLFYYDVEEFWFRDGRLLLRGNNGTGKSKVLALTLPFLLDGDLSPHRVEPDADPKKRMEWNLLLGGDHPHPERLGYTWLEFGRRRDDGTSEFRTLGCGLKAVAGRGIARHWFFLTDQRVGHDLDLVDATRTALTRDRLAEALAGRGTIHERAHEYRRAVDEALFGLGEQRYAALVDLLVQLRQPHLSKRPNEKALSAALTEALPPLDQAVVADVAEAFRSLEDDRAALRSVEDSSRAASSFLAHYRRYAGVASRRRAALPRKAQVAYEAVNRNLTEAQAAHDSAQQAVDDAETALAELDAGTARLRAQDETLRSSPQMRSARELEHAANHARTSAETGERLKRERAHAADQLAGREARAAEAETRADRAADELDTAREAATATARIARVDREHSERIDANLEGTQAGDLRHAAEQITERQHRAVGHVQQLLDTLAARRDDLAAARRRADELTAEAAQLAEQRRTAATDVRARGAELISQTRRYLDGTVELAVLDPASTLAALELWVETIDGANPVRAAVDAGHQAATAEIARAGATLGARHAATAQERDTLTDEISRLEGGELRAPPAAHTRAAGDRAGRPGAPLWRLVDFVDHLADDDRAGIEAALEAAGILDAWVTPDGELLSPDTHDVVVGAHADLPQPAVSLASVLRPAVDRDDTQAGAVDDTVIAGLLSAIGHGAGQGSVWVSADGQFRLGVLDGAWHKPAAEYVGSGAREAARRARLAQLRADLAGVERDLAEIAAAEHELGRRRAVLADEVAACPDDDEVRTAHATITALAAQQRHLDERMTRAGEAVAAATSQTDQADTELADGASELRLPTDAGSLAAIRDGLSRYREALAALWPAVRNLRDARRQLAEAGGDVESARTALSERTSLAAAAANAAEAAAVRHQTLADSVGTAVAELERRLADVGTQLRRCEADTKATRARRDHALSDRGNAEGQLTRLQVELDTATQQRAEAAESLRRFAATGLLAVALPDQDVPDAETGWAPNPTVLLARQIDRALAEVPDDDDSWERVQRRVDEELKALADTLSRYGHTASSRLQEDGIVVDVTFLGRSASVPALVDALSADVDERQRLLNAHEREILENHLVNEVASTLQELISAAEQQVAQMNAELSERPMSTGMRLRLRWLPVEDGPDGLPAARERLLRQSSDAWSEDDRAAVGEFLQARIAEVRAQDTTGTWIEHLAEALDYRRWHRFAIQRHQNGQWRSATGPASGGERVLAASVPLFAAASAHCASAGNPHAPRLVTLDEAFAGVDDTARAEYLGLLAAFDLDVVMTSEREWGCYPQVPGLGISQLSRTEDIPAVLVTQWEWDGRRRSRLDRPVAVAVGAGSESQPAGTDQHSLWA